MPWPVAPVPFFRPADSLIPGANFAHPARWAAVGNRVMSTPISAMITAAVVALTPGISISVATCCAKGDNWAPIWVSRSVMSASIASIRASILDNR